MKDMTVEEASNYLKNWLYGFGPSQDWWSTHERAVKTVLDRLKELDERKVKDDGK